MVCERPRRMTRSANNPPRCRRQPPACGIIRCFDILFTHVSILGMQIACPGINLLMSWGGHPFQRSFITLKILAFPRRGSYLKGPRVSKPLEQKQHTYPSRIHGRRAWGSPMGALGRLWEQILVTLAFKAIANAPPERFWDTVESKI